MTGPSVSEAKSTQRMYRMNRLHARLARLSLAARGFVSQPESRAIGSHARGRQLMAGNLLFAGRLVEAPGIPIWDAEMPDIAFAAEAHGCGWLDDLASAGHPGARRLAQDWVFGWIEHYSNGSGPGWTPELAARRLMRWIDHAPFLLIGRDRQDHRRFFRSLAQQTVFLSRRWQSSAPGLARCESLTGLVWAGLALMGMERRAEPAIAALAAECDAGIDDTGGIPTRNPEDLLEVLVTLNWAVAALTEAGRETPAPIRAAIERIAPCLRSLRHADGTLARFHGGEAGTEGRLDQALLASSVRHPPRQGLAMGFVRLAGGRCTLIADAAPPPVRAAAGNAHASTLAFELTSGRRPLIVSCGSGRSFGEDWRRAGRATPSHSALGIQGLSSARLVRMGGGEVLADGPAEVWMERADGDGEHRVTLSHDGWLNTHGLSCFRELALSLDGRTLGGEDALVSVSEADKRMFDFATEGAGVGGIPFSIRFHLHPEAQPELDLGGNAVSIALMSGEIWVFRHGGGVELSLEPSVYLERGRLKPRPTRQIVLSGRARDYSTRTSWTLAKALDTPTHQRDAEVARAAMPAQVGADVT